MFCHAYQHVNCSIHVCDKIEMKDPAEISDVDLETMTQDELTLQQQRDIEKEIKEKSDLVGELTPIESLEQEYEFDTVYRAKLSSLRANFSHFRRTRPDGNCFFRAFCYAFIEQLIENPNEFEPFLSTIREFKSLLLNLGFAEFTTEDFYVTFTEVVEKIRKIQSKTEAKQELQRSFNDQNLSDYMVVFLRIITSGSLQKDHDFYVNFIEGNRTVLEFCRHEVEPMYRESDHIHIIAICNALNAAVRVVYMDRGGESQDVVCHTFPEDKTPTVFLLYRPGHYDILYKK